MSTEHFVSLERRVVCFTPTVRSNKIPAQGTIQTWNRFKRIENKTRSTIFTLVILYLKACVGDVDKLRGYLLPLLKLHPPSSQKELAIDVTLTLGRHQKPQALLAASKEVENGAKGWKELRRPGSVSSRTPGLSQRNTTLNFWLSCGQTAAKNVFFLKQKFIPIKMDNNIKHH